MNVRSVVNFGVDLVGTLLLTRNKTNSLRLKIRFKNSTILKPLDITLDNSDNVHISNNVVLCEGLVLRLFEGCHLFIGEGTTIGPYSHISGVLCDKIIIVKKVMMASCVHISTVCHKYEDVTKPSLEQGYESKGNIIHGDNCWIGTGVIIMSGVEVDKNSVIGANSMVNHDVPPYSVAAGSPARIIKQYSPADKRWLAQ